MGYLAETLLPVSRICSVVIVSSYVAYIIFQLVTHKDVMGEEDDGGEEEVASLSIGMSVFVLAVTTVLVALSSQLLVETVEEVSLKANLSMHFIGIILLPIVGNA